jgi:hypothetical protein
MQKPPPVPSVHEPAAERIDVPGAGKAVGGIAGGAAGGIASAVVAPEPVAGAPTAPGLAVPGAPSFCSSCLTSMTSDGCRSRCDCESSCGGDHESCRAMNP